MFVFQKLFKVAEGTVVLYLCQSDDLEEVLILMRRKHEFTFVTRFIFRLFVFYTLPKKNGLLFGFMS